MVQTQGKFFGPTDFLLSDWLGGTVVFCDFIAASLVLGLFWINTCEPTTCASSKKGQDVLLLLSIYVQLLI